MRTLKLTLIILVTLMALPVLAYSDDRSDRLNSQSSSTFSPGYINAAKQQMESLKVNIPDQDKKKGFLENAIEYVNNKMGKKTQEQAPANQVANPELQKKTGSLNTSNSLNFAKQLGQLFPGETKIITSSLDYSVSIGSGEQVATGITGVSAERINGVLYVYAGFSDISNYKTTTITQLVNGVQSTVTVIDVKAIQDAIDFASYHVDEGGMVLVKEGQYAALSGQDWGVSLKSGVKLYGGYNDRGERDINKYATKLSHYSWGATMTIDAGVHDSEINGFKITSGGNYGIIMMGSGSNNLVINNEVQNSYYGIFSCRNLDSSNKVFNNIISNCTGGLYSDGYSRTNFINNEVHDCNWGLMGANADDALFRNNVVWNTDQGIYAGAATTSTYENNTIYGGSVYYQAWTWQGVDYSPILKNNLFIGVSSVPNSNSYITGNVSYSDNSLLGLDPAHGIFTSDLVNVGYSPSNNATDYNAINPVTYTVYTNSPSGDAGLNPSISTIAIYNPYQMNSDPLGYNSVRAFNSKNDMTSKIAGAFLANALKDADLLQGNIGKGGGLDLTVNLISKGAVQSSLSIPNIQITQQDMEIASKLANILRDPTSDQKLLIDSVKAFIQDMDQMEKEGAKSGDNPELAKASSDLLQMVANVLLAQAIPDLLKEGDMSSIRNIFSQLDSGKSKILTDYKESTKPYYDEVKKIIEKNTGAIDIQFDLKKLLQKEVPRSEIDKILEELKNKSKRSSEEDYILQQESKLKEKYIDPNKKKLEQDMKEMLSDVTKKLSATLEAVKPR